MPDPSRLASPSRAPRPPEPQVALLRWPEQDEERRRRAALGEPRILVTATGTVPPSLLDELEVWLVDDAGAGAVIDAVAVLRTAARAQGRPHLDDDGLLWFRDRWVALTEAQLVVMGVLVRNFGRLVRYDDLQEAYGHAGGSATARSFRALIGRLGVRLADIGLKLHSVKRQGILLVPA